MKEFFSFLSVGRTVGGGGTYYYHPPPGGWRVNSFSMHLFWPVKNGEEEEESQAFSSFYISSPKWIYNPTPLAGACRWAQSRVSPFAHCKVEPNAPFDCCCRRALPPCLFHSSIHFLCDLRRPVREVSSGPSLQSGPSIQWLFNVRKGGRGGERRPSPFSGALMSHSLARVELHTVVAAESSSSYKQPLSIDNFPSLSTRLFSFVCEWVRGWTQKALHGWINNTRAQPTTNATYLFLTPPHPDYRPIRVYARLVNNPRASIFVQITLEIPEWIYFDASIVMLHVSNLYFFFFYYTKNS